MSIDYEALITAFIRGSKDQVLLRGGHNRNFNVKIRNMINALGYYDLIKVIYDVENNTVTLRRKLPFSNDIRKGQL